MRRVIFGLCLLWSLPAAAMDPFESEDHSDNAANPIEAVSSAGCADKAVNVAADLSFKQLKTVGMLKSRRQHLLLMADGEQQIWVVEAGDIVGRDRWELRDISATELNFVQWQADCRPSEPIKLKF